MDVFSLRTAAVAAAVAFPIGAQAAPVGDTAVAFELHYLLEGRSASFGRVNTVDRFVDRFYAMRQGAPAWWTNDGWSAAASAAIQRIGAAEEHGLRPGDYHFSRLQQAVLGSASSTEVPKGVAQAELLLTRAVLGYLEDVANGRIDPSEIGWEAAVFDHFQAVAAAITAKLRRGQARSDAADTIGGRTVSFEVCEGHPQEEEVLQLLSQMRKQTDQLWERVSATNQEHPLEENRIKRVVFYFGQFVKGEEDEA